MKKLLVISIAVLVIASCFAVSAFATIRYVKPLGAGSFTGASWLNASNNLQAMINASAVGDEVWVSAGTYLPTADPFGNPTPTDPRDKTFYLKNGVKVYGGFVGTETLLSQRNVAANVTTLSGDFSNNDVVSGIGLTLSITGNAEDAYHVVLSVSAPASTYLDGFTIRGGNADDATGSSITVATKSVLRGYGGGMFNHTSNATINYCTFQGNSGTAGGGMYNAVSGLSLSHSNISQNKTGADGGGVCNSGGTPNITDCTFYGNRANNGGGMFNGANAMPLVEQCTFVKNVAKNGGGMNNEASAGTIDNTVFSNNTAYTAGGGIYNLANAPFIINCTLEGNTGNGATAVGAGIYYIQASGGSIKNTILWNNTTPTNPTDANREEVYNGSVGSVTVAYSIVRDAVLSGGILTVVGATLSNCLNTNPLFLNAANIDGSDNTPRTADDGLHLTLASPAIDAGDNALVTANDIKGVTRIQNGTVDMGAYEGVVANILTGSCDTFNINTGVKSMFPTSIYTLLPFGVVETTPRWKLVSLPTGAITPVSPYVINRTTWGYSNWISDQALAGTASAAGNFTYRIPFYTAVAGTPILAKFRFLADNSACANILDEAGGVIVGTHPLTVSFWVSGVYNCGVSSGTIAEFDVTNGGKVNQVVALPAGLHYVEMVLHNVSGLAGLDVWGNVGVYCPTIATNAFTPATASLSMSIFPNPTAAIVSIVVNNANNNLNDATYPITLTNIAGQTVVSTTITASDNTLNISDYPAGIYFLTLHDPNGGTTSSKVVKY